jgi:hypothetical protein
MKSDNAILGWVSLNVLLQGIKSAVIAVEPYLASVLTLSQIAVAVATVILIVYKIRAARKAAKVSDDE